MKQKESRLQNNTRQRQRRSRKMIILLGSSIVCLVIVLVIVFNISHVDESKAALMGATSKNIVLILDEVNSTEVSIKELPVARVAPVSANPQLGHSAKPLSPDN